MGASPADTGTVPVPQQSLRGPVDGQLAGRVVEWLEVDDLVRPTPVVGPPVPEDPTDWVVLARACLIAVFTACFVVFCWAAITGLAHR